MRPSFLRSERHARYRRSAAAVLIAFVCFLPAQVNPADTGRERDERGPALRVVESLVTAWNKNDTEAIARLFIPDATLVMPKGELLRSRAQIRKRIADERQGRLNGTTLSHTIEKISFPDAASAVISGKYRLEGMKILGIKTSPAGPFVLRQKKHQGRWMIVKADISRKTSS